MGSILGIGLDLAEVGRVRRAVERNRQRFLKRVYREVETQYCFAQKDPWPSLAARWAAKEACFKAMSAAWKGGWQPSDIEVLRADDGRVSLALRGAMQLPKGTRLHLSITHTRDHAAAVVVWEQGPAARRSAG